MDTLNAQIILFALSTVFLSFPHSAVEAQLFAPGVAYTVGNGPSALAISDLDHDGKQDLVVANQYGDDISVLLGNGDGTFGSAVNFWAGEEPNDVAVGDFDQDGNLDLVVALSTYYFYDSFSILLGNGDGTFQNAVGYFAWESACSVVTEDLDQDGNLDLALAHNPPEGSNVVTIFLGNGDGTFQFFTDLVAPDGTPSLATEKLDGDDIPDLAVSSSSNGTVSIWLGDGDGTFQARTDYDAGSFPYSLAIDDLTGDSLPDLAVTNFGTTVEVLPGNGDGTFQAATSSGSTGSSGPLAIEDLDADSIPDAAVVSNASDTVSVLPGNGDGTFQSAVDFGTGDYPSDVAISDLNGNGKPDLAVANFSDDTVTVLINTGGSTISASLTCAPSIGTVPMTTRMTASLSNDFAGQARRIAAKIHLTFGGCGSISGWRSGYTNVAPEGTYFAAWNQNIPALGSLIGDNVFTLAAEDVTPSPFNQPPYPPAGDNATDSCTVTAIAP